MTQKVLPLGYMAEKDWKGTKSEKSDFEKRSIKAKGTIGLIFFALINFIYIFHRLLVVKVLNCLWQSFIFIQDRGRYYKIANVFAYDLGGYNGQQQISVFSCTGEKGYLSTENVSWAVVGIFMGHTTSST